MAEIWFKVICTSSHYVLITDFVGQAIISSALLGNNTATSPKQFDTIIAKLRKISVGLFGQLMASISPVWGYPSMSFLQVTSSSQQQLHLGSNPWGMF